MYEPPKSNVLIDEDEISQPIKAIIVATLFDIIGSIVFFALYDIGYDIIQELKGLSEQERYEAYQTLGFYSAYSLIGMSVGILFSFVGGYICAKIANKNEYLIVLLLAGIVILSGYIEGYESYTLLQNIALDIATLIAVYSGAWLYVINKRKR